MSLILRSVLLILSISTLINALLIDGQTIHGGEPLLGNTYVCSNVNTTYDQKLLRINDTLNKNFTILLHPNLTGTADTFLNSMRCYFGDILFQYYTVRSQDNSVENMNNGICDAFNKISNREDKSLRPLLVVFPPQIKNFSRREPYLSNEAYPPCTHFQTSAMTIQVKVLNDSKVSLYIRTNNADYVIKSVQDCPTLFDSIAAVMNPSMHSDFHFPYQPLQIKMTKVEDDIASWHAAAVAAVAIGLVLIFVVPGIIVWGRVKARQRQRDQDKQLREAMCLKSRHDEPEAI